MKRMLPLLLAFVLCLTSAQATILPAEGVHRDFYDSTGIECVPAVILSAPLAIYDARDGQQTAEINDIGSVIPSIQCVEGWTEIFYDDGAKTGWVRSNNLLIDPQWYLCDTQTQLYAYPDTSAHCIARLDAGTRLSVFLDTGTQRGDWVCVNFRGATGWVQKTHEDAESTVWFYQESLAEIATALLVYNDGTFAQIQSEEACETLFTILTCANDLGGSVANCSFGATIHVYTKDGQQFTLQLATDASCILRINGQDYAYTTTRWSPHGPSDRTELLSLFGLCEWGNW